MALAIRLGQWGSRFVAERYGVLQVAALRRLVRQCLHGCELQRPPAAPGPEGLGARRGEGCRARDARPSHGCFPAQYGAAGHRLGAPAQALSRGPGPHQGLRRQRPLEPRPRTRDRRAERTGEARRRGRLCQDGRRAGGGHPRAPAGRARGTDPGVRGPVVSRDARANCAP